MKQIYIFFVLLIAVLTACTASLKTKEAQTLNSGIRLDNFDKSVRPQDDFYRYVNGTWLKNTKIPADKSNYGTFTVLADKAREDMRAIIESSAANKNAKKGSEAQKVGDLFNSYMNVDAIERMGLTPIENEFAKIDSISNTDELVAYFAEAHTIGADAPFGFYVYPDSKNPDSYITFFVHTGLGLPDRDFYLKDDEKSQQLRDAYLAHIENMLSLAEFANTSATAKSIMMLETRLAEIHWDKVDRRDREKTYNKYTLEALTDLAPAINWQRYLEASGIPSQKEHIIRTPSFYSGLSKLLNETTLDEWKNYQKWHVLTNFANILPSKFDDENFSFYGKILNGRQEQEERWKRAVSAVNGVLGEMVGKVYVEKHFRPEAKERMIELVENLREAYRVSIIELDWMGEETKKEALKKLKKFRPKIGYPDKWRDYSSLNISADSLVDNYINAYRFNHEIAINKLGKPIDRDEWGMTPQTVNAYYSPNLNEIVFPAAILQPPFFNLEANDAVNYGAIGAVIGHEMGHGFDDQGAKSDGDGRLRNWWTEKDLQEFQRRTSKLVEQFNEYEVLPGEFLNGKFTLGENIGDLGGLTISYKAYQLSLEGKNSKELDGFTGEQRFFIGWAQVWARLYRDEELSRRITTDVHSPSEFRTNGIVKNMTSFVEAFDVNEGDELYIPPKDRVKIW